MNMLQVMVKCIICGRLSFIYKELKAYFMLTNHFSFDSCRIVHKIQLEIFIRLGIFVLFAFSVARRNFLIWYEIWQEDQMFSLWFDTGYLMKQPNCFILKTKQMDIWFSFPFIYLCIYSWHRMIKEKTDIELIHMVYYSRSMLQEEEQKITWYDIFLEWIMHVSKNDYLDKMIHLKLTLSFN